MYNNMYILPFAYEISAVIEWLGLTVLSVYSLFAVLVDDILQGDASHSFETAMRSSFAFQQSHSSASSLWSLHHASPKRLSDGTAS